MDPGAESVFKKGGLWFGCSGSTGGYLLETEMIALILRIGRK